MKDFTLQELMEGVQYHASIPKNVKRKLSDMPVNLVAILEFERVKKEDNRKVMLDCERIATTEDGAEIYQSANRNVITIIKDGIYNHIILQDILDAVLNTK
jgi:hypothetical protein